MNSPSLYQQEQRIQRYIEVTHTLAAGVYDVEIPIEGQDVVGRLGVSLQALAQELQVRYLEVLRLDQITSKINAGLLLDDILESVYRDFSNIIPYNRIGLSLIEDGGMLIRARWAKTDQDQVFISKGYAAQLEGSSLQTIIETGQPRILNDLAEYLEAKPESKSTRLIVAEGIRSSLTCPLVANGVPIGFIFFSSIYPNVYSDVHVEIFLKVAAQLSVIVEKGRLVSALAAQKEAVELQHRELQRLYALQEEYLRQVAHVTRAATQVEAGAFEPASLDGVAQRTDELGKLAQVFQTMAHEVYAREQTLKQQVQALRIEIDEVKRARQVSEIAETDFFQDLKQQARQLRARRGRDDGL